MLRLKDVNLLAKSKIKAHKVSFFLFVIVISLLLTVATIANGANQSINNDIEEYSKNSLAGRFFVDALSPRYSFSENAEITNNKKIWENAEKLYNQDMTKKKQIARKLGVSYEPNKDEAPTSYSEGEKVFNDWNPYSRQAIADYLESLKIDDSKKNLESKLSGYDYKKVYRWHNLVQNGTVTPLTDGKEKMDDYKSSMSSEDESILSGFEVINKELYKDYVTEKYSKDDNEIPIIIPEATARKYLKEEKQDATDYESIVKKISGAKIEACYRNEASKNLIFTAEAANDDKNSEIKYNLPTENCGATTVKSDKRSRQEKEYERKYQEFLRETDGIEDPVEKSVSFKVIGVIPSGSTYTQNPTTIKEMIENLGQIDIATSIIPEDYFEANQDELTSIYKDYGEEQDISNLGHGYIIEFNNRDSAISFVNKNSCSDETIKPCLDKNKPFYLAYNNKSVVISDLRSKAEAAILAIVGSIIIIAIAITISSTISSINRERKEISIYKAIGYKNRDIKQIYLTQTVLTTIIAILISAILAAIISVILNQTLSTEFAEYLSNVFSIYGKRIPTLICTLDLGFILGVSLILLLSTTISTLIISSIMLRRNIVDGLRYE